MQWQLQWRGMGSKLENGIEGKKMKDLEHKSQSLGTKSVSHKPIFFIFFFLFFFLLVCTHTRMCAHTHTQKEKEKKRGVR